MSGEYCLACPLCGSAIPFDQVEFDEEPTQFARCPECEATSDSDEWVEAEPQS